MSYQAGLKKDVLMANHTICLQIGSVRCALKSRDTEIFPKFKQLYRGFLTEEPPDITVELVEADQSSPADLGEALSETKFIHENNQFWTTSNLVTGQYDLTRQSICFTGIKSLADPAAELNHLNKMLALAYYSACKVKYDGNPPAMLVHACGIIRHGQALLFTGPSEAGKTTIARLSRGEDCQVVNDEILLVSHPAPLDHSIIIQSAPILGRFASRPGAIAPLRCIFILKKGGQTGVCRLAQTEAYLKLMRQVITPAYIGQRDRRTVYSLIADFSAEVTGNVPVFELEFNLDKEKLWQTVTQLEKTLAGEERK
jgi:hypothetical protein